MIALAIILLLQVSPYWFPTGDGQNYISIARSLATGQGLRLHGSRHIFYAPGYSILISPVFTLGSTPFLSLSAVHVLLLLVLALGVYKWAARFVPDQALAITLLASCNVGVLYYFRRVGSEAAFVPLLVWAAVALDQLLTCQQRRQFTWRLLLATCLVSCLCVVRQAGLTLAAGFCAMVIWQACKGRIRKRTACVAVLAVGLAAIAATSATVFHDRASARAENSGATYSSMAIAADTSLTSQMAEGLRLRIQETARLMVPGMFRAQVGWWEPGMILLVPTFIAVCVGWWRLMRFRPSSLLWTCPFYLALHIIWPYEAASRYMMPLVPAMWASIVFLIASSRLQSRLTPVLTMMVVASLTASVIGWVDDLRHAIRSDHNWAIARLVSQRVPAEAMLGLLDMSNDLPLFISIIRDKPTASATSTHIPPEIPYLLASAATSTPAGFSPIQIGEGYVLLERRAN